MHAEADAIFGVTSRAITVRFGKSQLTLGVGFIAISLLLRPVAEGRGREAASAARNSEAYKFFEKGLAAEEAGKANVAKIYYNMAARRAPDELKDAVQAKLDALQAQ